MFKYLFLFFLFLFSPFSVNAEILGPKTDKVLAESISKSQDIMKQVVEYSVKGLKDAKNVAVEQAPIIVKEYIKWKLLQNVIQVLGGLILLGLGIWISWGAFHWGGAEPVIIIGACMLFASGAMLWFGIMELIYIYAAPRIYVIEHLVELIKHGTM